MWRQDLVTSRKRVASTVTITEVESGLSALRARVAERPLDRARDLVDDREAGRLAVRLSPLQNPEQQRRLSAAQEASDDVNGWTPVVAHLVLLVSPQ